MRGLFVVRSCQHNFTLTSDDQPDIVLKLKGLS